MKRIHFVQKMGASTHPHIVIAAYLHQFIEAVFYGNERAKLISLS